MRIIFLNTFHGQVWEKLKEFIFDQSKITDIFCFTEVDPAFQVKLVELLPEYQPYYEELIRTIFLNGTIDGQSIFVKEGIEVESFGKQMIYKISMEDAGALQAARIKAQGTEFFIGSVHGKALPGEKLDTPQRIKQSETIINYFKDKKGPKIIGGDFNLSPETKSVAMFESAGYKNLIKEFDIQSTRNKISWEQFKSIQHFADYCFVTSDIKVKNFEVPYNEISDHLPLILDFDL